MLDVFVVGPTPGSAGGVGVMCSYLNTTTSGRTRVRFIDSGGSPGAPLARLKAMATATVRCLRTDQNPTVYVLSLSSGGSTWRKVVLSAALTLRKKPYVLHLHGGGFPTFYANQRGIGKKIIRWLYHTSVGVLVLGASWAEFVNTELDVPAEKITIIPNAVPGPHSVPDKAATPIRVLFTGRVGARKGVRELLAAWGKAQLGDQAQLVLAGDLDDPTQEISAEIDKATNVEFLGWLEAAGIKHQLSQAHIVVLPSYAENLPLSLLEGMAWGLAPIATPVGAVPEVIEHGVNGILVGVQDADALAQALKNLVTENAVRERMATAARNTWEHKYSLGQYRPIFDDAVENAYRNRGQAKGKQ